MSELDVSKELIHGAIAGICGKIIEFPFDTIKVRLQSSTNNVSTSKMIYHTYSNEGIFNGFYQGIKAPLIGACLENAILFTSYNASLQYIRRQIGSDEVKLYHKCFSGGISGFMVSFILAPVELVKCQLQVSNLIKPKEVELANSGSMYTNVIKQVIHHDGILGLWRGLGSTLMREIAGTAIWFGAYEVSNEYLESKRPKSQLNSLICGAFAGLSFNLITFPIDTIKSNMQISGMGGQKLNYIGIIRNLGLRSLYNGLTITLIRSLPANAMIFYTYETLKNNF